MEVVQEAWSRGKVPGYCFGTGPRSAYKTLYRGKLETSETGHDSPGPLYLVTDKLKFKAAPWYSIGKGLRATTDIACAGGEMTSISLHTKGGNGAKFGRAEREMKLAFGTESPGPKYLPPQRMSEAAAPRFTIGVRRLRPTHSLDLMTSTTPIVGPGRYTPSLYAYHSRAYSIPKRLRDTVPITTTSLNQTYAGQMNSCGLQVPSNKRTVPIYGFGISTREQLKGLGVVRTSLDQRELKVRIEQKH